MHFRLYLFLFSNYSLSLPEFALTVRILPFVCKQLHIVICDFSNVFFFNLRYFWGIFCTLYNSKHVLDYNLYGCLCYIECELKCLHAMFESHNPNFHETIFNQRQLFNLTFGFESFFFALVFFFLISLRALPLLT